MNKPFTVDYGPEEAAMQDYLRDGERRAFGIQFDDEIPHRGEHLHPRRGRDRNHGVLGRIRCLVGGLVSRHSGLKNARCDQS